MIPAPRVLRGALAALLFIAVLAWGSTAFATSISLNGPSLHGATGALTIVGDGSGNYRVRWEIDFDGFDVKDALKTDHDELTHVAFKAFDRIDSIVMADPTIGKLYYPSNVNSGANGCDTNGSKAGFVCLALANPVDATRGGTYAVDFAVTGQVTQGEWSYRGKFGGAKGWVISEPGTAVPEPSAALVFAIGAMVMARRIRR